MAFAPYFKHVRRMRACACMCCAYVRECVRHWAGADVLGGAWLFFFGLLPSPPTDSALLEQTKTLRADNAKKDEELQKKQEVWFALCARLFYACVCACVCVHKTMGWQQRVHMLKLT